MHNNSMGWDILEHFNKAEIRRLYMKVKYERTHIIYIHSETKIYSDTFNISHIITVYSL